MPNIKSNSLKWLPFFLPNQNKNNLQKIQIIKNNINFSIMSKHIQN